MCCWSYFDSHFHSFGQTAAQLNFNHKSDDLSHRTVRNGRRIINLNLFVRLHRTPFKAYHTQLLQSERVFRIIDISNQFVNLVLVEGVVDVVIELCLPPFFLLVEAELVSLMQFRLRVLHQNNQILFYTSHLVDLGILVGLFPCRMNLISLFVAPRSVFFTSDLRSLLLKLFLSL